MINFYKDSELQKPSLHTKQSGLSETKLGGDHGGRPEQVWLVAVTICLWKSRFAYGQRKLKRVRRLEATALTMK